MVACIIAIHYDGTLVELFCFPDKIVAARLSRWLKTRERSP
jgi:hypothetical protein